MEDKHHFVKLTSADITILWKTYIQSTAVRCFYKHFLQNLQDVEIKPMVEEALNNVDYTIGNVEAIFNEEKFPIPKGFSDKDVDLSAPALFTDLYALSFVYRGGQITIPHYANALTKVTRMDIYALLEECQSRETELHRKVLNLMFSKGIFDRPPKIEYPKEAEFIEHQPSLVNTWLGEKRPLNVLELAEIFQDIERNGMGLVLLIGFLQVTKDKEIKNYLLKGKKLAENQIETLDQLLKENDHHIGSPVPIEVTNSTTSPFSERLILFLISASNQVAISKLGDALSVSMRKDLAVQYGRFIADVMKFGDEGQKLMIERGWMEKPPQPMDRNKLYKS